MFVLKSHKIKKKTKIVIVNIFVKNRLKKRSKEAVKMCIIFALKRGLKNVQKRP